MTELDVGVWWWVSLKYAPGVGLLTTINTNELFSYKKNIILPTYSLNHTKTALFKVDTFRIQLFVHSEEHWRPYMTGIVMASEGTIGLVIAHRNCCSWLVGLHNLDSNQFTLATSQIR